MLKKKAANAAKTPLFDRIFKPKAMTLDNAHSVQKPRSRQWLIWGGLLAAVWLSVVVTKFDFSIIIKRGHQFTVILEKIFNPDFNYIDKVIPPLLDTIKMSVMGSVIGSTLALPFAVVSSTNINRNAVDVLVTPWL